VNSARDKPRIGKDRVLWSQGYEAGDDDDTGMRYSITATVDVDDVPGWTVAMRYELVDGTVALTKVELEPVRGAKPNPGGDLMRKLGFGKLQAGVLHQIRHLDPVIPLPKEWVDAQWNAQPRPGRAGNPPIFYATWAQRWLDAKYDEATRRWPIKHLAEQHPGYSEDNIGQIINRAKYTTKPPMLKKARGVWGLTARAERLLEKGA
jgi:hypothetical protein